MILIAYLRKYTAYLGCWYALFTKGLEFANTYNGVARTLKK